MSVVLRMKKFGTKKKPYFRIVAITKSKKRDGEPVEELGHYDPKKVTDKVKINKERIEYWLSAGAIPSSTVKSILKKQGIK